MRRPISLFVICLLAVVTLSAHLGGGLSHAARHEKEETRAASVMAQGGQTIYLPLVTAPEELVPSAEVVLQITPAGGLYASTFEPHAFTLTSDGANEQAISQVTIDLRTAVFPDMVFDPNGLAGDVVAKNLEIDSGGARVGFAGHTFASPHDDGFDVLTLSFNHFAPGESVAFSVDVDPTSIRGAAVPGPNQSGSVSGVELVGTTVQVTLADNTLLTGQTYRLPGDVGGSQAVVRAGVPDAPQVTVVGVAGTTAVVTETQQIVAIDVTPRQRTHVFVVEGGLFTAGVPGGGHDLDPFEANSALTMRAYDAITNGNHLHIPIQLSRTHEDGGYNMIVVVQENAFGFKGAVSTPIILELQN